MVQLILPKLWLTGDKVLGDISAGDPKGENIDTFREL